MSNQLLSFNSKTFHQLMRNNWGCDFSSPIEQELKKRKDFKVLDVGCGIGTWLLQLSSDYPSAEFFGLDNSSIFFPKEFSQNNLQFIHGDILKGLPFENNTFDFVHAGCLSSEFTAKEWEEKVINELVRVCKPGGWIEISDMEGLISLGPTFKRLIVFGINYFDHKGIQPESIIEETIPESLDATNYIESIYEDERVIPIGDWAGERGKLALEFFYTIFKLNYFWSGITKEEYEILINQFMMEVNDYHPHILTIRLCCQKTKTI